MSILSCSIDCRVCRLVELLQGIQLVCRPWKRLVDQLYRLDGISICTPSELGGESGKSVKCAIDVGLVPEPFSPSPYTADDK